MLILDSWQGSEYASVTLFIKFRSSIFLLRSFHFLNNHFTTTGITERSSILILYKVIRWFSYDMFCFYGSHLGPLGHHQHSLLNDIYKCKASPSLNWNAYHDCQLENQHAYVTITKIFKILLTYSWRLYLRRCNVLSLWSGSLKSSFNFLNLYNVLKDFQILEHFSKIPSCQILILNLNSYVFLSLSTGNTSV